jgi:hypothetical protein
MKKTSYWWREPMLRPHGKENLKPKQTFCGSKVAKDLVGRSREEDKERMDKWRKSAAEAGRGTKESHASRLA